MGKVYKKVCKDCGRRFETESSNKRLCPDCVEGRLAERVQKTRQGYKKPEAIRKKVNVDSGSVKKETSKKWDMRKCKKCFYGAKLDGKDQICDYITITGHMRPCDPGAECTVFLQKEDGNKLRGKVDANKKRCGKTFSFEGERTSK